MTGKLQKLEERITSCSGFFVPQRFARASCLGIAIAVFWFSGCRGTDARLQQHREKFESISNTTVAIGEAWLSGRVSGTYARAALERAFALLAQERTRLDGTPQNLLDARGARLSESAERLSRLLAAIRHDVQFADGISVRRRLDEIRSGQEYR